MAGGAADVANRRHLSISTDELEHFSADTDLGHHGLGRGRQARLLVGLNVGLPVEHAPAELQKLGADPRAAPALKGGLADTPARGQLFLIEMNDFHLGLLPNELAGVHEGAVPVASQAIVGADPFAAKKRSWRSSENRATLGVNGCQFGIEIGTVSRSGNRRPNHAPTTLNIPDREISLALSPVVADNFPNGKLGKP